MPKEEERQLRSFKAISSLLPREVNSFDLKYLKCVFLHSTIFLQHSSPKGNL